MPTNVTSSLPKDIKRLRVFAGPNGSGKSSIFQLISEHLHGGAYVNADDMLRNLDTSAGVPLSLFLPSLNGDDFQVYYSEHPLRAGGEIPFPFVVHQDGRLTLAETCSVSSSRASATAILADYVLTRLLEAGEDVAFEAVSAQPSEVSLMRRAKELGYRVTLYYVCVATPEICKQRVALRVTQGGLGVPDAEVDDQYERSLASLKDAATLADRAYLFDNTYSGASLKIEVNQATDVIAHEPVLPDWLTRSLPALIAKQ